MKPTLPVEGQPGRYERTVQAWDAYRKRSNKSTFGTVPLEYQLFAQYIVGMAMAKESELRAALTQAQEERDESRKLERWSQETLTAFRAKFGVPSNCQALDEIDALEERAEQAETQLVAALAEIERLKKSHEWDRVHFKASVDFWKAQLAEQDRGPASPPKIECGARKAGTAGGNYPQDCDWPFCGCDEKATKVIETLQECGWSAAQPASTAPRLPSPAQMAEKIVCDVIGIESMVDVQRVERYLEQLFNPKPPEAGAAQDKETK